MNPLIKPLLKLIETFGGFAGIQKMLDGKKTHLTCTAIILIGSGWIAYQVYLFSQKQIDANTAYLQITVCGAAIGDAVKSIFQRMATAKATAQIAAPTVSGDCAKPEVSE